MDPHSVNNIPTRVEVVPFYPRREFEADTTEKMDLICKIDFSR